MPVINLTKRFTTEAERAPSRPKSPGKFIARFGTVCWLEDRTYTPIPDGSFGNQEAAKAEADRLNRVKKTWRDVRRKSGDFNRGKPGD